MSTKSERVPSVRRRLFALLLLPAIGVLIAGTLSDYFTAAAPFREAYDQALIDTAIAVSTHVEVDQDGKPKIVLPPDAVSILRADSYDSIYFRVSGPDGRFIYGDEDLPELAPRVNNPARGDATYRGEKIRLVSYRTLGPAGAITVSVGETLHKRDRARRNILTTSLAVDVAQLGLVLAMIWFGVRVALAPLQNVEAQIAHRSARDLAPLGTASVPIEIRSLVSALNRLFLTVTQTSAAQRRFLESAAHQLRTPLTGLQAQLELLADEEAGSPTQPRLLMALEGARRLGHTTHQLLTLARSDQAANLNWELVPIDLPSIVETVITDRLTAADAAGIDLGAEIEPASVRGVAWLLTEALGNLTNNAIAYTPKGGSVTVRCGVREGAPFLRVTDTGIGIPPEERTRVLERFFRASNTRGGGSGLGLAIVNEVAQLHGAAVAIDAGPDGKGTAITIQFPVPPGAPAA
ncbi:MAG: sensor histidine kinase N-terminal domain-containing protein [Gammaproteobacteria bacterium]